MFRITGKDRITRNILTSIAVASVLGLAAGTARASVISTCGEPATLISVIQGSGAASLIAGSTVTIEGVVVGDFQDGVGAHGDLNGFFVQEEDADADANPATSEGIFVFDGSSPSVDVASGDLVRVTGDVAEFNGLTELDNLTEVIVCGNMALPTAASLSLPVASLSDLEVFEGMLVATAQSLTVSDNFFLGRFGELTLSNGRLFQPTQVDVPGIPALAVGEANGRNRIILDDGFTGQNLEPIPYLDASNTRRGGDTVGSLTAVLDDRFGDYRLLPIGSVPFANANPRPQPPAVGGSLKVASYNTLNYFTTIDTGAAICGPGGDLNCRGANSTSEFDRQKAKIVAALNKIDADVIGLVRLENNASASLDSLVQGLNAVAGAGTYAFINTGSIGSDAIKVGIIYKPATVAPAGSFAVLDSTVDTNFNDLKNRPSLAQSFDTVATGARLTVAVNHFKSKGTPCDDVGDPDVLDGQEDCNLTRKNAALALADWLASDPTGSGDPDVLIIGDLNAYPMEDPIAALKLAGFVDLLKPASGPDQTYSFIFEAESGRIDHALASPSLAAQISGASPWHINTDEPPFLDYNEEFKSAGQIAALANDEFRSSNEDPIVVGLMPLSDDADGDGVVDSQDDCPDSILTTYVVVDGCNSAVENIVFADGCSIADDLAALGEDARNHGAFASAAARYLQGLVDDEILSAAEKGAIQACVAQADIP